MVSLYSSDQNEHIFEFLSGDHHLVQYSRAPYSPFPKLKQSGLYAGCPQILARPSGDGEYP